MRLRRRPKLLAWGTFCPVCRTVRSNLTEVRMLCNGGPHHPLHNRQIIEVVDLFDRPGQEQP